MEIEAKEMILRQLRERGFRITKQRRLIIDTILNSEYSCCKEIYYQAHRKDPSIGIATVYRMVKTLEEVGVIDRKQQYRVFCDSSEHLCAVCTKLAGGDQMPELSPQEWSEVLKTGLKAKGYLRDECADAAMAM